MNRPSAPARKMAGEGGCATLDRHQNQACAASMAEQAKAKATYPCGAQDEPGGAALIVALSLTLNSSKPCVPADRPCHRASPQASRPTPERRMARTV